MAGVSKLIKSVNLTGFPLLRYNLIMKTLTVAELKSHFSDVVNDLKNGKEVRITYGRSKQPLATIVPQSKLTQPDYSIKLGTLQKKGQHLDLSRFEITDKELFEA